MFPNCKRSTGAGRTSSPLSGITPANHPREGFVGLPFMTYTSSISSKLPYFAPSGDGICFGDIPPRLEMWSALYFSVTSSKIGALPSPEMRWVLPTGMSVLRRITLLDTKVPFFPNGNRSNKPENSPFFFGGLVSSTLSFRSWSTTAAVLLIASLSVSFATSTSEGLRPLASMSSWY